jgi:N-acetylglucosamine kinase-like BadF-type ATPase
VATLLGSAAAVWPNDFVCVRGIGVGATGLGTLVTRPQDVVSSIREVFTHLQQASKSFNPEPPEPPAVAIAIDAVTAHLGALGGEAGAICALGTGAIAFGSNRDDVWRRVDGWGHLLGDRGSGAWIGMRALSVAILAHDGVDDAGTAILAAASERYGDPSLWPAQLYTRNDRAGVLAEFVPDLLALAERGDRAAREIVVAAGVSAARSTIAALGTDLPHVVAGTGALLRAPTLLRESFERTLTGSLPDASLRDPVGDPIDGAVMLAQGAASGGQAARDGYVWTSADERHCAS